MFFYYAVAIGVEKFYKFINLPEQFLAFISIAHTHTLLAQLHNLRCAHDVGAVLYRLLSRSKRLMLHELESTAVIHERISGYTCRAMVSLGKSPVD